MLLGSSDVPRALARDPAEADLSPPDRAMIDYALKLSRTPHAIDTEDVEGLRSVGFDDRAILDICQVTCYYAYVNRLADGLGVELEERWTEEELTMTREEFEALVAAEEGPGPT
jgi:uncharacterized peroxidase-related enzyme